MKNYIQPGDVITLVAPADTKSGMVVTVGAFTGIAATDAAAGGEVEVALTGVFELPKAAAAVAQGALFFGTARRWLRRAATMMSCSARSLPQLAPMPGPAASA